MRLSRTDVVPLLAIVAGGAIGASVTFALLWAPYGPAPAPVQPASMPTTVWPTPTVSFDVPPQPVWSPDAPTRPVWSPDGQTVVFESANGRMYRVPAWGGEPDPIVISPDGQWIVYRSEEGGESLVWVRRLDGKDVQLRLVDGVPIDPEAPRVGN